MVRSKGIKIAGSGRGEKVRKGRKGAMTWEERTSKIVA
jgi:hypothetical protein